MLALSNSWCERNPAVVCPFYFYLVYPTIVLQGDSWPTRKTWFGLLLLWTFFRACRGRDRSDTFFEAFVEDFSSNTL